MRPACKRELVGVVRGEWGVSIRRACRVELATVRIDAVAKSPGARLWRHIWGALLRESGF